MIIRHLALLALLVTLGAIAAPRAARADEPLAVGLYAPSAAFAGTADRLGFVSSLADHLSQALGRKVHGRLYASAGALDGALTSGEIQFAIIDAPNLSQRGGKPLTTLTRNGANGATWVVAGGNITNLGGLAGKRVAVAQVGGREAAFVTGVMFEGEVDVSYLGAVVDAPDAASAAKLVTLGKADVAVVPASGDLAGLQPGLTLRSLPQPSLIRSSRVTDDVSAKVVAAARTWSGVGAYGAFGAPIPVPAAGRGKKRPIMATTPPRRLEFTPVLGTRPLVAPTTELRKYLQAR